MTSHKSCFVDRIWDFTGPWGWQRSSTLYSNLLLFIGPILCPLGFAKVNLCCCCWVFAFFWSCIRYIWLSLLLLFLSSRLGSFKQILQFGCSTIHVPHPLVSSPLLLLIPGLGACYLCFLKRPVKYSVYLAILIYILMFSFSSSLSAIILSF